MAKKLMSPIDRLEYPDGSIWNTDAPNHPAIGGEVYFWPDEFTLDEREARRLLSKRINAVGDALMKMWKAKNASTI